jgi:DmsE family decaheme c-type cytochrome
MRPIMKVALLAGFLSLLGGIPAMAQTPGAGQAPTTPPQAQQAAFAGGGAQTCLKCHDTDAKVTPILQTPHAMTGDKHTPFAQDGCEDCHGPSAAHVASRSNSPAVLFKGPNKSPAAVRNAQCLTCHENGLRMNWQGSAHEVNDKACNDCHTIHIAKDPVLVKATQPETCFTCHPRQRADSMKLSHHPIREGKVVCSDCHNPHGAVGDTKLLKEFTVNETCYTCHAEKRGPLLWEHQPVRENCTNCHTPHGSNEPRLMKERMNFLCSSCHSAASNNSGGAFGGPHSIPFRGPGTPSFNSALANQRQCLNCHSQIHGSNSPSGAYFFR